MSFNYVATDIKTGRKVQGLSFAESIPVLSSRLVAEGKIPVRITHAKTGEGSQARMSTARKGRVRGKEVAVFTRQVAATLSAGLLLSDALQTVAEHFGNPYFESVIRAVREKVRSGQSLSQAMAAYPQIFSKAYLSVIRTGEATGQLHLTLTNLAKYLENNERLKEKVRGAIQYPAFILIFAVLVVTGIVVFIIPKFKEIFEQLGADLPWLTGVVLKLSDFLIGNVGWIILSVFLGLTAFVNLLRWDQFSYCFDVFKLKIPLIGKEVLHKSIVTRFCQTLGFLLASGVPIASALDITAQVVNHKPIEKSVIKIKSRVLCGTPLSEAIREQQCFPLLVYKMSHVGERTGGLAVMLDKAAQYYSEDLETTVQSLMVLIEPLLIMVVGLIVGIIVVALYLPIFRVSLLV